MFFATSSNSVCRVTHWIVSSKAVRVWKSKSASCCTKCRGLQSKPLVHTLSIGEEGEPAMQAEQNRLIKLEADVMAVQV